MSEKGERERRLRKLQCAGKKKYPSQADAGGAIAWIVENRHVSGLHAYKCDFCGNLHIGHA